MIGELGTRGSIYNSTAEGLTATVSTIDNNRTMVVGVSADEELTNMIKYQAAYNAASRYINVISSMIETLVNTMQ
jgi:flagellar hook-associated protein 1 FlgK